ncbi:DUF4445 domain-containing protein [candidate division KSB1 bacterium]|nr:DUF4445 domain-containing protein [candidate division KSB1 bacterium]
MADRNQTTVENSAKRRARITFLPHERHGEVKIGTPMRQVAQQFGISDFEMPCGGVGLCGKCRVRVVSGQAPVTRQDQKYFSRQELKQGWRLGCQMLVKNDLTLEIPTRTTAGSIRLTTGIVHHVTPDSGIFVVTRPDPCAPSLFEDLALNEQPIDADLESVALLGKSLPGQKLICWQNRILDVSDKEALSLYGIAFDIGTTTLVGKLINLETGSVVALDSDLNGQVTLGGDVMSRLALVQNERSSSQLQKAVLSSMNRIVRRVSEKAQIDSAQIYLASIAGNSAMLHLLLAIDTRSLAQLPFSPVFRTMDTVSASDMGLKINPRARIRLLPIIGRHVGGDATGVLLSLESELRGTWLAIDIGTNGEILLCHEGQIWATSAAAGPAFEGTQISQGMRAAPGAIERVFFKEHRFVCNTIADQLPKGICGSGLIDAIGTALQEGLVDSTGRIIHSDKNKTVIKDPLALLLTPEVILTQKDIRQVQLAKGAIATGIDILMSTAGLGIDDLNAIYLAGAFGQYVRPDMAQAIGLFPQVPLEHVQVIGNAAATGAERVLISRAQMEIANKIARETTYIELADHPDFQERFAENMLFPA